MSGEGEKRDPRILWSGDIVGILMDSGIMSFPSYNEPIPEKEELVSHLRVSRDTSFQSVDFRRCMFRIQNDIGLRSDIFFGSIVTLTHQPSGLLVAGSEDLDTGYEHPSAQLQNLQFQDEPLNVVYLLSPDAIDGEDTSHRWIISPRYNLREDGEPVRTGDYIYLRNAKYQSKYLSPFTVSARNPIQRTRFEDLVGCASAEYVQARPGLQINILRKCPRALDDGEGGGGGNAKKSKKGKKKKKKRKSKKKVQNKTEEELEEERVERTTVFSGDFVRVYHREHRGHVICRVNDEDAFNSVVTPLGLVNSRRGMRKESTHGIYSRKLTAQQPRTTLDFPLTYSSLGVWQILPGETTGAASSSEEPTSFSTIMSTKPVRLRHLVSGQYLALRPVRKGDVAELKKYTSFKVRDIEEKTLAKTEIKGEEGGMDGESVVTSSSCASGAPAHAAESAGEDKFKNPVTLLLTGSTAFDLRFTNASTSNFNVYLIMEYGAATSVKSSEEDSSSRSKGTVEEEADSDDEVVDSERPWRYVTEPQSYGANQILWKINEDDPKAVMKVKESLALTQTFTVKVARTNDAGKEVILATGDVMLPNDLSSVERDEEIECSMQLVDTTKSRKYAGSLKVYLSSKQDYDKAAIENYLLGDFGNQAEMDKEILDTADRDEEEQFQHYRNYEWVLATCSEANAYSEFNLVEVDVNEREVIVNYGEMFAFEHRLTKQRLKLADMVGFVDCVPQWWEYQSDMALVPVYTRPGAILDAEVCQFERVDVDEVIDILYCSRFISIARACTASLQLSARAEHLYKPMFRHFQRSLQTLVLWTLGEIESDSCLCNDASGGDERKEENANVADQVEDNAVVIPDLPSGRKGSFYQAAASPSSSSRKLRQMLFGSAKEATAAEGDSSQFALGMSFVNAIGLGNGFQRGYHVPEDQLKDEDEEVGSIVDSSSSRSVSDAPSSRASSRNDEIIDNGISFDESEEASEVGEEIVEDVNTSSLAPWIGRTILRGTALFGDDNDVHSDLHRYASHVLHEFLSKNVPMNAVLYRRQVILAESMIIEQILHFINVLFLLQRAITSTSDERILKKYPCVPEFILVCSKEIHNVMRASIYKNETVALKIISINGSFLSLMSQMIMGWDPPIQSILEMTCGHGEVSPSDIEENKSDAHGAKAHSAEDVLISAISESDLYQIVQQMMDLNVHNDSTATKILKLLTMLCKSGKARRHFQDLMIDAIAHTDVQPMVQGTVMAAGTRASSLQTNSLLFYSRCMDGKWQVSFGNPFNFHSQEARDPAAYVRRAETEASSLVSLFMFYNDNEDEDDMTLDMGECFNMLQDLGLGGPFLHLETHNLAGSSVWSMLKWWCYRYSFYYPSSSNSHCQLSPVHVMQAMKLEVTDAYLSNEALRVASKSGNEYTDLEFFMDVINSDVTGLYLNFEGEEINITDDMDQMIESMMVPRGGSDIDDHKEDTKSQSEAVTPRVALLRNQMSKRISESLRKGKAHRKKMASRHQHRHVKAVSSPQWHDVMDVFVHEDKSLRWFRQSLRLLTELCYGGNLNVQEKATILVPAEFILHVLQNEKQIGLPDRSLMLKLLQNLYIVHDHVHPTRCLPVHAMSLKYNDRVVYSGHKEEILNPSFSIGKVFNSLSRVKFYGDGAMDGASLRAMLFEYVKASLKNIRLCYTSKVESELVAEILRIFHKLLKVGFFQEPDMHFFSDADTATNGTLELDSVLHETDVDYMNSAIGIRSASDRAQAPRAVERTADLAETGFEPNVLSSSSSNFTINDVQKLLIKRLNERTLILRCTTDFSFHHAKAESNKNISAKRKLLELDPEVGDHPTTAWTARTLAKRRRDFNKLKKSFDFFDVMHSDLTNIRLVLSAVRILETILDMKQYLRLQKSWNYIGDVSDHFAKKALTSHTDSFGYFFDGINFESYFQHAFQADRHREPCYGYTLGVLRATVHESFELRRTCYNLLNRKLCLARDADLMMKSMQFVKDPTDAFKRRILSVFVATLSKNLEEIAERPYRKSTHHLERFMVAMEHIRALCFTEFLGREFAESANSHGGDPWAGASLGAHGGTSRHSSAGEKTLARSPKRKQRTSYNLISRHETTWLAPEYLESEIPCVNPLDDELQLAKEEYFNSEQRFNALCAEYQYRFHAIENVMGDSHQKLDCADMLFRLSTRLITTLEKVTCAPHLMPWSSFYTSEKFIIDESFGLLASIGCNEQNQRLCQGWFDAVSPMLMEYFPSSVGTTNLIAVFFRQCGHTPPQKLSLEQDETDVKKIHKSSFKNFVTMILRNAVSEGLSKSNTYARLITALLLNRSKVAVQLAITFYVPYVLKFSKRFPFTHDSISLLRDDFVLRNTFHYIMRPYRLSLARASELRIDIPSAMMEVGRRLYSKDFVNKCIRSQEVSMGLKVDLMHIAYHLCPDYDKHPLEEIVMPTLRRMRVALSIQEEAEVEASTCYGYCKEFLFDGVLKLLETRLSQCSITSTDRVNYLIGAIITGESNNTAPNKPIAAFIAEHLKANVFALGMGQEHAANITSSHDMLRKSASRDLMGSSDDEAEAEGQFSALRELSAERQVVRQQTSGQYVPTATVECFMMVLNILRLNEGVLAMDLPEVYTYQILTVASSVYLLLRDYQSLVINPADNRPINAEVAERVKNRLSKLLTKLVHEVLVAQTKKLLKDLFFSQTLRIGRFNLNSLAISAPERMNFTPFSEEKEFAEFMQLGKVFPAHFIRASPLFKAFEEHFDSAIDFLGLGGNLMFGDWRNATLNSKAFARKFGSYTYFDMWMRGGGRFLVSLFGYLGKVVKPSKLEYNLLHVLIQLMKHQVYDIQNMTRLSLSVRQQRIECELRRFQVVQSAMADLGANKLVTSVLGRAVDRVTDSFQWVYAPLTVTFANQVVAFQNQEIQEDLIAQVQQNIAMRKPPEMNMLLGMQALIRGCSNKLSYSPNPPDHVHHSMEADYLHPEDGGMFAGNEHVVHSGVAGQITAHWYQLRRRRQQKRSRFRGMSCNADWDHTKILRVVNEMFAFVGIFCKGDNTLSQNFFSAFQAETREFVDLIQELGSLANVCASKFTSMVEYIGDEEFYERIAPPIWEAKDSSKRRFLAWEHHSNCMPLFTQYLYTFSILFDNMVGIFNTRTASDLQQALLKIPDILEFTGLMQLNTKAKVLTIGALGQNSHRTVRWFGGDPFRFYRAYFNEMSAARLLIDQEQIDAIKDALDRFIIAKDATFGVTPELFKKFVHVSEDKCLSTLLSFLDYASPTMANDLYLKLPENIMLQNMNNIFLIQQRRRSAASESISAVIVKYLSILEAMAIPIPDVGELIMKWRDESAARGFDPRNVFATVEIISKTDKVQKVFFPIPHFVTTYWLYPIVQSTKERIVLEVNRDSAEEKLADFYEWMKKLLFVMKRQEVLRRVLTYPVHALLGGKTTRYNRFLPSIRATSMVITAILNVYFAYYSSLPNRFRPPRDSFAYDIKNNTTLYEVWHYIRLAHIGMHGSIAFTSIINSSAIEDTLRYYSSESKWNFLVMILVSPLAVWHLVMESLWAISMTGFAFLAGYWDMYWFYTPMLVDVAFQVKFLSFLFHALSLNTYKIAYTVLLACLCLWFYSVLATLYFHGQYDFDGHYGCENVVACFKLHLDYGLYNVPNWAGDFYITPELDGELSFVYGRTVLARLIGTVYNITYVILINLVLQSIISGLIIDTFSQLREENEATLRDIGDKCFICSITKDDFEQNEISFDLHIKEEHNMWHYLWFQIYLDSKDELTYSSVENYAAEEFSEKSSFVRLMPIKRSWAIEQKDQGEVEDFKIDERLDDLANMLARIQRQQVNSQKVLDYLKKALTRIDTKR